MNPSDSQMKRAFGPARFLQCEVGEGDPAKANSLLDESLAVSNELGMKLLMERVLSRREKLIA